MEPQRTCIGCREVTAKSGLRRLAWDATTSAVVIDSAQRLPGRGCYLHPQCVGIVLRRRAVGRALRREVDAVQVAAALAVLAAA